DLLLLTLQASPTAPIGGVYTISVAAAQISDETPHQSTVTDLVAPGRVTVVTCAPRTPGDVNGNGTVDLGDAIGALRIAVLGVPRANACAQAAADVNWDGAIDLQDAILLLQRVALNKPLPTCHG